MPCGLVVSRPDSPSADRPLGDSVGAIEWSVGVRRAQRVGPARLGPLRRFPNSRNAPLPPRGGCTPGPRLTAAPGLRVVTWLILPVVICLSQRLSHACLSISNYTVKLRMAH